MSWKRRHTIIRLFRGYDPELKKSYGIYKKALLRIQNAYTT